MSERLVTQDDLNKYPELKSKGVSVNQRYNFSFLESQTNGTPPVARTMIPEIDKKVAPKKPANGRKK